jgi:transposase
MGTFRATTRAFVVLGEVTAPWRQRERRGWSSTGLSQRTEAVAQTGSVRPGQEHAGMAQNFIESRRGQEYLLPPDVREWLPADHLAWFVLDAVAEMDLSALYAAYRADGHGRAAYEPSLMVALILYAFATKVRSSRAIECHCRQDVAYRVITGNLVPDHATIARFICRHERALAELFAEVLRLCAKAGLVKPGVVSIDGTRIAGNASPEVNYGFEQIACEIVAEVKATDAAEDAEFGDARGDELPEQLHTAAGRREFFRRARQQMRREEERPEPVGEPEADAADEAPLELDANEIVGADDRGAMRGCGRASASSSRVAGRTRIRSRSRGVSGCCCRPSDCSQISMSSAAPTRRMRPTGRRGG